MFLYRHNANLNRRHIETTETNTKLWFWKVCSITLYNYHSFYNLILFIQYLMAIKIDQYNI